MLRFQREDFKNALAIAINKEKLVKNILRYSFSLNTQTTILYTLTLDLHTLKLSIDFIISIEREKKQSCVPFVINL